MEKYINSIIIWLIRMLQTQKTHLITQIVDFTYIKPDYAQFQELAYYSDRFYQVFHLKTTKYGDFRGTRVKAILNLWVRFNIASELPYNLYSLITLTVIKEY